MRSLLNWYLLNSILSDSAIEISLVSFLLIHLWLVHMRSIIFDEIYGSHNYEIIPVYICHLLSFLLIHFLLFFLILSNEILVIKSLSAIHQDTHFIFQVLCNSILESCWDIETLTVGINKTHEKLEHFMGWFQEIKCRVHLFSLSKSHQKLFTILGNKLGRVFYNINFLL